VDLPVVLEGLGKGVGFHHFDAGGAHCFSFGIIKSEADDGFDPACMCTGCVDWEDEPGMAIVDDFLWATLVGGDDGQA